ncbi:phenylalanine--tRNA ligase subunit beta [Mumia sp. zg.B53]|uniref:phenylalanine--tRNA ligase subunit beta n=1 Tax=unclassified Mumia TaxID=2621872 RepID=UPI001C6E5AAD|nr:MULTISPECIES: phenylalanine--tRNA ligase subunit beta [unclassified Mumia]MBW9205998.1 phenylalanine--tRNA ligase subunit beta [Mumia sp. zg.B17]MBW9216880.1 phenylalanine--tRNA ligase subunit beta [Mumia sp. zg.B53]MDD9347412.1 phenylalanine--tRNA ligase subunit beta [Mumia sp.]
MRVPVSWLREYADLPTDLSTAALADRLTMLDLKLEEIDAVGADISGPIVVGRVLSAEPEPQKNGKTINWCSVDVGPDHNAADGAPRGIVCGAHNFGPGDLVVVALPGSVLPGPFAISSRKTYGHVSDGMICSGAELGTAGDPDGIIVLPEGSAEVGDDAIALLGLREDVLDLEVNPDRAYALSLRGVARDAAMGYEVGFRDPAAIEVPSDGSDAYPVVVEDPLACPVFVTRTVTGFDPTRPTPRWMARRLELMGMRPISLAVDVTNYVMLELGQPIHGYDRSALTGPITVRRGRPGEKVTTLDDVVRDVTPDDLLITDDSGPIGLAGVMGGQTTELAAGTTDIVIEAAHFDPPTIARTARLQRLGSEASRRFERGVDPALPPYAAQRVAELLVEHGGGRISDGLTSVGTPPAAPQISLADDLPARISGVDVDAETAVRALEANACTVEHEAGTLHVVPPSWRLDLTDPYDVVEEVLRYVGYDKVPSVLPHAPAGRGLSTQQRLRRRAGLVLAGAGYVEVKTFPFAGPADFDQLGIPEDDPRRDQVLLENPLSAEEPGLTTTLMTGAMKALALNVGRGHDDVAIFETGRVFLPKESAPEAPVYGVDRAPSAEEYAAFDEALPDQPLHLVLAATGRRERAGWWGDGRRVQWADAVEAVRRVASAVHVDLAVGGGEVPAPWHPGRTAVLRVDGAPVGFAGELHPRVCRAYGVPARTVAAEVDLDAILGAAPELGPRPSFSTYPVAKEDVALVVAESVPSQDVADALLEGGGDLVESVRLFDVYTGEQVPAGHKSLAFALRMRAPERTLTEAETATVRDAAVARAGEVTGAVQRT